MDKPGLKEDSKDYTATLKSLKLFSGIDDDIFNGIISNSKLIKNSKGKEIFLQGEPAQHVYLLLEGAIKLFKSNAEGEEMVMQIVAKGDTFLEAVTFNSKNYPASAIAIENIAMLAIPKAVLSKNINGNKALSLNMLDISADYSQELIAHIEQITMKTVAERIGWFLLRMFTKSASKTNTEKLPYEKSMIASYLGMKPETFSRALKKLKKHGINIDNNVVTLNDKSSLCEYCDSDIISVCKHTESKACLQTKDIAHINEL